MRFSVAGAFLSPNELVPLAQACEASGYHAFSVSDHVVNLKEISSPYPYTSDGSRRWEPFTPWIDPWIAIAAMAAVTERLQFFTNVYVLPMRHPVHVAKAVSSASIMSAGRVSLGIGMGWCEDEFELLNESFAGRGKRADEMIEILQTLWSEGWVSYEGTHFQLPELEMSPVPGEIPILVGGLSAPALRRAARHDGWISDLLSTEAAASHIAEIEKYRSELGRTGEFSHIVSLDDALTVDQFKAAEELGVTDILTMPWVYYSGEMDPPLEIKIEGLERFASDVVDHLR